MGNYHARFLGGWARATAPGYPPRASLSVVCVVSGAGQASILLATGCSACLSLYFGAGARVAARGQAGSRRHDPAHRRAETSVAGAGQEIRTRPFQLVTGRVWKGTAFGGARGHTDVPKIVDWDMDGKIDIDDLITHVLPLDRIDEGFELMHAGQSFRAVVTY